MRAVYYRVAAAFSAFLVFLGISLLHVYGDKDLYQRIMTLYGVVPFYTPFLDISGSLAAWECARLGVDVVVYDPCDVLQRGYNYSPLWMAVSGIPLGVDDTPIVGWTLDLLFIAGLSALPPPRRPPELILVIAATLSTTVAFALERANPDILLFLLALIAGVLAERGSALRLLGYSIALTAALLKYYPVMMLITVFRERPSRFIAAMTAIAAALAVFLAAYYAEIARALPTIAHGPYNTGFFGAKNLPFLLGEAIGTAFGPSSWAPLAERAFAGSIYATLVGSCLVICRRLSASGELSAMLNSLSSLERGFLVIGSAVIAGCFFAGQSIGYRGVFFLMVIPGLLGISRRPSGRNLRTTGIGTTVVIVLLMWGECFRLALDRSLEGSGVSEMLTVYLGFLLWLIRELCWWWSIAVILAMLAAFLRNAPIVRWASSRLNRSVGAFGQPTMR
jgi:hypothetical protein